MREKTQTATVAHLSNNIIENIKIPLLNPKEIEKIDKNFKSYIRSIRDIKNKFGRLSKSF